MEELNIIDNKSSQRFEVKVNDDYAYIDYRWHEGKIYIMHTFVPASLRGKGLADKLAKFALEYIQREKLESKIYCPYVSAYIRKHPEYKSWENKIAEPNQ